MLRNLLFVLVYDLLVVIQEVFSYLLEVLPNNKVILIDSDTSKGLTFTEKTTTNWFQPGCQHTILKLQKKNHLFQKMGLAVLIIYAITQ